MKSLFQIFLILFSFHYHCECNTVVEPIITPIESYCDDLERNLTFLGFQNRCRLRRRFQCAGYIFPSPFALYNSGENTRIYCHLGQFSDYASLQQETDGTHAFIAWNGPEYSDTLRSFDDVDIVVVDEYSYSTG